MQDPDERAHDDQEPDSPNHNDNSGAGRPPATAQLPVVRRDKAGAASVEATEAAQSEAPDIGADPASDVAPAPSPEPIMATQRVVVVRLSGANDGEVTPITSDMIIIGRLADDLTITLRRDPWVSRRHASLSFHDNGWWIEDLKSSNGTYIGEEREKVTQPTPLPLNEVFRVGHTDLMLSDAPDYLSQGAQRI